MTEPMSDERLADIRKWVTERPWKVDGFTLDLLPEVDRLRAELADARGRIDAAVAVAEGATHGLRPQYAAIVGEFMTTVTAVLTAPDEERAD